MMLKLKTEKDVKWIGSAKDFTFAEIATSKVLENEGLTEQRDISELFET